MPRSAGGQNGNSAQGSCPSSGQRPIICPHGDLENLPFAARRSGNTPAVFYDRSLLAFGKVFTRRCPRYPCSPTNIR
jgi:hypothetical protein